MKTVSKLTQLQDKTGKLLAKALKDVKQGRRNALEAKEARFRTAEYLLTEARDYVDASWELLSSGKPRASLATSRWVLEGALNLLWVTKEARELDERLMLLAAEGLRLEAALLEGLAKLFPKLPEPFKDGATNARRQMKGLVDQPRWRLDPLKNRMDSLKVSPDVEAAPDPYSLYRVCCDATHPALALHRRFRFAPGGATVTRKPPDATEIAIYISGVSALWLVSAAYCLTELDNADYLNRWWKDVAPLVRQ